jgi:hypothetical protein
MEWWKKFPWRRLVALLIIALSLMFAMTNVRGEKMYVKVASSNPDAVILSSTDFFEAEAVGTLLQNQPVEMMDKSDGEFVMIEATVDGKKVQGWVKKIILQKKPLENVPRVSESGAVDNASFAAPGFNKEIEGGMRKDSPQMKQALERLDEFEGKRAELMGIKNWDSDTKADSTEALKHYRDFGKTGGLK